MGKAVAHCEQFALFFAKNNLIWILERTRQRDVIILSTLVLTVVL